MPTITLSSGKRISNQLYRLDCRTYDSGNKDRLIVSFFNPLQLTKDELAEFKSSVSNNYYGMAISAVEVRMPSKSYVGFEWTKMNAKTIRKQIREWLRGGNMVRANSHRMGGSQSCSSCFERNRTGRAQNYSACLSPLSMSNVKCVVCVSEDIFNGGKPFDADTLESCSRCGDRKALGMMTTINGKTTVFKAKKGQPTAVCNSCLAYYCNDRQCWNCNKPFVAKQDVSVAFYGMYGVGGNYHSAHEIHFCDDCNFVPKRNCGLCGENEATTIFKDTATLPETIYQVCQGCATERVGSCVRCDKQEWLSSNSMRLIESYYDSSAGEGKNFWACRGCIGYLPKCGKCDNTKTLAELQEFAGMCQGCAGNAITSNVFYYRENVLDHIAPQGKANRKLGVELELEWDGADSRLSQIINDIRRDTEEWGIVKRDGSLKAGIEFVTTPLTLDIHQDGIWTDFCRVLGQSFTAKSTCGLHVHVSKIGVSNDGANKLLKLVYYNPSFWIDVAGRESKRYAPIRDVVLEQAVGDRYTALNFKNEPTFEFRMFGASTDADYIVARIELCDAAVRFSNSKLSDIDNMSVGSFYRYIRNNRRLYPLALKLFKSRFANAKSVETDLHWRMWTFPTRRVGRPRHQRIGRSGRPAPPRYGEDDGWLAPSYGEVYGGTGYGFTQDVMELEPTLPHSLEPTTPSSVEASMIDNGYPSVEQIAIARETLSELEFRSWLQTFTIPRQERVTGEEIFPF